MITFSARIYKIGINPVIDPPDEALAAVFDRAGKSKGAIPVCGRLNGSEFIQTLVKYKGSWRLYVNGEMLRSSGLETGDIANVEMGFDPRPREVAVPPKLAAALRTDRPARTAFESLSPSRRKEILRYLGSLKTEGSLERNIERTLRHLRGESTDGLHALMRRPKDSK